MMCHPRLPLVAGLDSERPTVHVWDCAAGQPRRLGTVGAESSDYADAGWRRMQRTPAVTWHPDQPLLLVSGENGLVQWTRAGFSEPEGLPATARYRNLAFSPDGRTLWASPSSGDEEDAWERSDVLDLASGTVSTGPSWDTGIAEHPAGGLVATLFSNQGATLGLFARVDDDTRPAAMRVLRRALILDADGYRTPIFSPDGRHLAIRGNAYGNTPNVFEFPSLHCVLTTALGDPYPGHPCPPEWLEQMRAWSRHNIAFGAQPGVLWVGTPTGTLIEVDLHSQRAVEHDVLAGSPVTALTALTATTTGHLLVAGGGGELALLSLRADSLRPDSATARTLDADGSRAAVASFLAATSEVPDVGDLETHLVVTDGTRTWERDDLESTTTATATDPSWLQLQAAVNTARAQDE
ncbi:PD40 domain-containing protein [Streptomyces olivochromogenes]|nr:PD40 domain-containing protein [Streptomyces olivochromogenes]